MNMDKDMEIKLCNTNMKEHEHKPVKNTLILKLEYVLYNVMYIYIFMNMNMNMDGNMSKNINMNMIIILNIDR
jgi:hypothetical protein